MKREEIFGFLKHDGFKLIDEKSSEYFKDYYIVFSDAIIQVRFTSSKSIETIDVCSSFDNENWYDLALIKAMLLKEKILNKSITIEEYRGFLFHELVRIKELFSDTKYAETREEIRKLEEVRMQQMFPNIIRDKYKIR